MASVFINNLDDYIAPSQACVNPLVLARENDNSTSATLKPSRITIQAEEATMETETPTYHEVKPDLIKSRISSSSSKVAAVSLNDCLACSGCITTAESVLIQQQSYSKLLDRLDARMDDESHVIVGVSPQTIASLAAYLQISGMDAYLRIRSVLKAIGVSHVVDMSAVGDIALVEAAEEFIQRYKGGHRGLWESPPTTSSISSKAVSTANNEVVFVGTPETNLCLPMFASQCPGWICYAEKSQPQSIPYISSTKSPQQIFGRVVREILHESEGIAHSIPYIVSIQPCFDKKLEASRRDFYHEDNQYDEIDLVISTTEIWNLIEDQAKLHGHDSAYEYIHQVVVDSTFTSFERLFSSFSEDGQRFVSSAHSEGGSGGYIDYILRYASQKILNVNIWDEKLNYKIGRNPDFAEVEVRSIDSNAKLKFARAYGFRNIQSMMQKMKRGKGSEYDFVEIMACPSGCVNGGGQIKIDGITETPEMSRHRVANVESVLRDSHAFRRPESSTLVKYLYNSKRLGEPMSPSAQDILHTRYHAVPKLELVAPLVVKW